MDAKGARNPGYRIDTRCISRATNHDVTPSSPDSVDLIRVTPEDEQMAWTLFRNRSERRYSFTDCTSFALMRRLGIDAALALDEDFRAEGFRVMP